MILVLFNQLPSVRKITVIGVQFYSISRKLERQCIRCC